MTVSQVALAAMLLSCFIGGVVLTLVYEILLIPKFLLCGAWFPWIHRWKQRLSLPDSLCPWNKLFGDHKSRPPKEYSIWQKIVPFILTMAADFSFCVIAAVVLMLLLYATNDGAFRWSALFTMLLGVVLGRVTLARWMAFTAQLLYTAIRAGLVFLIAVVCYPVLWGLIQLWLISAPYRHRTITCYQQRKVARRIKKEKQKQLRNTTPQPQPAAAISVRPQPDGRRVFCSGRAE